MLGRVVAFKCDQMGKVDQDGDQPAGEVVEFSPHAAQSLEALQVAGGSARVLGSVGELRDSNFEHVADPQRLDVPKRARACLDLLNGRLIETDRLGELGLRYPSGLPVLEHVRADHLIGRQPVAHAANGITNQFS